MTAIGRYRSRSARAFERVMTESGLAVTAQQTALADQLAHDTPIHRRTLLEWKQGKRRLPFEVFLAACELAGRDPAEVMRVVDRTCGHPLRVAGHRLYCDREPGHEERGIPHRVPVEVPLETASRGTVSGVG